MSPDEKEVREAWEQPWISEDWGPNRGEWGVCLKPLGPCVFTFDTEEAAWSAAAAFTRQRREEIREVEEEIVWLQQRLRVANGEAEDWARAGMDVLALAWTEEVDICKRILAIEQARRADLKRGWKGGNLLPWNRESKIARKV